MLSFSTPQKHRDNLSEILCLGNTESPIYHDELQSSSSQLKFQDKVIHDILEIQTPNKPLSKNSSASCCVRQFTSEGDIELFKTEAKDLGNSIDNLMPDYLNNSQINQFQILQEKIDTRKNLLVEFQQTSLDQVEEAHQEFVDDIEFEMKNDHSEHRGFVDVYLSPTKTQPRTQESKLNELQIKK